MPSSIRYSIYIITFSVVAALTYWVLHTLIVDWVPASEPARVFGVSVVFAVINAASVVAWIPGFLDRIEEKNARTNADIAFMHAIPSNAPRWPNHHH